MHTYDSLSAVSSVHANVTNQNYNEVSNFSSGIKQQINLYDFREGAYLLTCTRKLHLVIESIV